MNKQLNFNNNNSNIYNHINDNINLNELYTYSNNYNDNKLKSIETILFDHIILVILICFMISFLSGYVGSHFYYKGKKISTKIYKPI